jgi:hypothetical protein
LIGPILRLSNGGICIKLLTDGADGTYGCYTYKPFIGRVGIAEWLRALPYELATNAAGRENTRICNEVASSSARFRRGLSRSVGGHDADFDLLARPHDRQQ